IDPDFEEATEGEEVDRKEKLKTKWARLEAMVGTEKRISLIAQDIVDHFEKRLDALEGKAMIVCMSRRICVDLYSAIAHLRPSWQGDQDGAGIMKVIIARRASDAVEWQQHIRNKARRDKLPDRFRDNSRAVKNVLARNMWRPAFDAASPHTMYAVKPMHG